MTDKLKRRDVLAGAAALAAAGPVMAQTPAAPAPADGIIRVSLQTTAGEIVLGLESVKAPLTTANFLRYIDAKRYDGGTFYRTMRSDTPTAAPWGLIQGGSDRKKPRFPGVAHESTTQTGLSNTTGAIALARAAPGSATSDFFISVGDMKGLDADPKAEGDDLGFAAFGHVISGMDVAQKIHQMSTSAEAEVEAMRGQMLATPVVITTAKRVV